MSRRPQLPVTRIAARVARLVALAIVVVTMSTGPLHAQCPTPSEMGKVAKSFRVRWNVGEFLVTPGSTQGVNFWFATNRTARAGGQRVQRQFDEQFEPDKLIEWLVFTRQLLELKAPLPNDTSTVVTSGYLRGLGGGMVVVARMRKGTKLSDKARVLMSSRSDSLILLELDRASVDTLLTASETAAQQSGYSPPAVKRDSVPPVIVEVTSIPSTHFPRYPYGLQERGIEGEVWARFCVGVDGRADLSTFYPQVYDHEEFVEAVKEYLKVARYKPATRNGTPIRLMASQLFVFGLDR